MEKYEINVPDGYELVMVEECKYEIKLKEKNELPKTWEEYCERYKLNKEECYIDSGSNITHASFNRERHGYKDKNLLKSYKQAEAFIALMQLVRLRDCYNESIVGETDTGKGGSIVSAGGCPFVIYNDIFVTHVLSFKTRELAQQFMDNFIDLIEKAKELI